MHGLVLANEKQVPLKAINVSIKITGTVAEVESNLVYDNQEDQPIEATFTFPVDDGSAVYKFEAEIEGRKLVAEIQEREQAKLTYEDSIRQGKTAALLQQDDKCADIFKCSLGNLPAHSEAKLMLSYVIELPQEIDGRLRFTLPTILNPRYSPDMGGEVAAAGATYVPPSVVPYTFSMIAFVHGYHKVLGVTSDHCKLNIQLEEDSRVAKVTLAEEFKFDHDICLLVQYENCFEPQVVMEMGKPEADGLFKEDLLMLSFHPDLKEVSMATNGEYIFVIDRSGSMSGTQIKNAKEALLLFLKSLPPDCYFNVVSFGSSFESLFDFSAKYSDKSLSKALRLQTELDANMGGTEILSPLETIFTQNTIEGHSRRIFVLTDGEVSNTDNVIGLVQKNANTTRTFCLGIGHGASTALVNGIARAGHGKAEFITDSSRIQSKVISLLRCAMQPACTQVALDWDLPPNVNPMLIPNELPQLVTAGERLTLYAFMHGVNLNAVNGTSSVTLRGHVEGQPVSYTMTFTLTDDTKHFAATFPVHRLASKAQIKLLEDEEASLWEEEKSYYVIGQNAETELSQVRERLIVLSRHANIVSKMTAFVLVDKDGAKVEGEVVERSCPVPTLSWENFEAMQSGPQISCSSMGMEFYEDTSYDVNVYECVVPKSQQIYSAYARARTTCSSEEVCTRCSFDSAYIPSDSVNCASSNPKDFPAKDKQVPPLSPTEVDCNYKSECIPSSSVNCAPSNPNDFPAEDKQVTPLPPTKVKESSSRRLAKFLSFGLFKKKKKIASPPDRHPTLAMKSSAPSEKKQIIDDMSEQDLDNEMDRTKNQTFNDSADASSSQTSLKAPDDDTLMAVIKLQKLKGNWALTQQVADLLKLTIEQILFATGLKDDSACTVAVLAWMEKFYSSRKEEWQLIEIKARAWLETQNMDEKSVRELLINCSSTFWN